MIGTIFTAEKFQIGAGLSGYVAEITRIFYVDLDAYNEIVSAAA